MPGDYAGGLQKIPDPETPGRQYPAPVCSADVKAGGHLRTGYPEGTSYMLWEQQRKCFQKYVLKM